MDGEALILNHNYFLKSAVGKLSKDIAKHSIYEYLENDLGMNIVNSKRIITVEKADEIDEKYLNLNLEEYNCLAVVDRGRSHYPNAEKTSTAGVWWAGSWFSADAF